MTSSPLPSVAPLGSLLPTSRRESSAAAAISPCAPSVKPRDWSGVKNWSGVKTWTKRTIGLLITLGIFAWMAKPIFHDWDQFKSHVYEIRWGRLVMASMMFSLFLFAFRVQSWRSILRGLGHRLPMAPAVRIWSTSELARYLPGVIWQVVGRVYLIKPYGVSGGVCSVSQVLELVIFLLANVFIAISCLLWNGSKHVQGPARDWLFGAMALAPVLVLLLHPRIFNSLMDRILRRMGQTEMSRRVGFGRLALLLAWASAGLVWQGLAIWLVTAPPLGLQFTKWWVVGGAYALAWCAGFLAIWAPGGIGVREFVFVTALRFALPAPVRQRFDNPAAMLGFLAFLSVLLRLWATAGELMLAAVGYAFDISGALGKPNAKGRTPIGG